MNPISEEDILHEISGRKKLYIKKGNEIWDPTKRTIDFSHELQIKMQCLDQSISNSIYFRGKFLTKYT